MPWNRFLASLKLEKFGLSPIPMFPSLDLPDPPLVSHFTLYLYTSLGTVMQSLHDQGRTRETGLHLKAGGLSGLSDASIKGRVL
jgi:hypothetical protein